MSGIDDRELEDLKAVSCAVLLERQASPYTLDKSESTRNCLKYRRGKGEIILVTHGGRGWWDPGSTTAKGDIFNLVQHLQPGLNFGQARRVLRDFVGIAPSYPPHLKAHDRSKPAVPVDVRWGRRPVMWCGSPGWTYLTATRHLPRSVLKAAISHQQLREGPHASAWFAHRDHDGRLTGIEIRGPEYRGFSSGGDKTLFRLPGAPVGSRAPVIRLVVTEAPIDALSLASLEGLRHDTLYVSTAGGMGPHTLQALGQAMQSLAQQSGGVVGAAFDADEPGERYAAYLTELAAGVGLPVNRMIPPEGRKDWNDVLVGRAGA